MLSTVIVCLVILPLRSWAESDDTGLYLAMNTAVHENTHRVTNTSQSTDGQTVCFEDIDCFSKTGPMKHIGLLPATPDRINTRFIVYTSAQPNTGHELNLKVAKTLSVIVPNKVMAIVIHGFANTANKTELIALKNSLINFAGITTVILVDWSRGAASPWYTEAATNTQVVGRQIAFMVNVLRMNGLINPYSIHVLGYSLGAHVAGFAGKYSQIKFNWRFGRITALDAASPLFERFPGSHLTKEDAFFVDAIHTSAGTNILKGEVGFIGPVGHIDFYPNFSTRQPRCQGKGVLSGCDHISSVYYMESSLRAHTNCLFIAFKCNSWQEFSSNTCRDKIGVAVMGYLSVLSKSRGNHYLKTTAIYPFCSDNKFSRKAIN